MDLIHKTAAGKAVGSLSYVLSDATTDRMGDIVEPAGWDLRWFRQNPIALFGHNSSMPVGTWKNVRVEGGKLIAELSPAQRGTSPRIDEIISLIEQDILRATSVGFRPTKEEPLDPEKPWRGTRFLQQELLEASIVSVPANPAALQVARSLNISDETMTEVFGVQAVQRRAVASGVHADPYPTPASRAPPRTPPQMNISAQIEAAQSRLNASRDALTAYVAEEEQDPVQRDAMSSDVLAIETELRSLENAERALAPRTGQQLERQQLPSGGRRPLDAPAKRIAPQAYLWRAAAVHLRATVLHRSVDDVLKEFYPDDEGTEVIVRGAEWVQRAAVAGATTTAAGWAAELVITAPGDFLSNLLPTSVFPRLAALGTPLQFGPGRGAIKIPSRATTPSIGASFVAEGAPIPVRRLGLTSITLSPHKVGGLSVFSREIAKYSNPQIEAIIREGITDDTAINIDALLLDNIASSVVRPAGLTNGVAALTASTAKGATAIMADLQALTNPFYAVNAGRKLVLMMNPAQGQQLNFAPGPSGSGVPFGWTSQFTSRFTVIESTSIAAGSVYMVDAADFVSVNGAAEFEVSEQATLHMEDTTPLNIGTAGTPPVVAAPVQSMFQTAQIAIRMLADVTWQMRRAGMVQWMTGVNWGP